MRAQYLFFLFAWVLQGVDNTFSAEKCYTNQLLNLKAHYDELFDTIPQDKKQCWPDFKNEYFKKHHLDIKLQLIQAQCRTRLIQSLLTRARLNIYITLNDCRKSDIVAEINAMRRQIEKDKKRAELCALSVELQAKEAFINTLNK